MLTAMVDLVDVPGVTIKAIVDAGVITADTTLVGGKRNEYTGTITADGLIQLITKNSQLKEYASPSGAARAVTGLHLNGWLYWKVLDSGIYKELAYYREQYKQLIGKGNLQK